MAELTVVAGADRISAELRKWQSEFRGALVTIGHAKGGLMTFEFGKLVIDSLHEMLTWGFRDCTVRHDDQP